MKCPGQDWRYWKEDAIFEINCLYCGERVEFFKDDTVRKCPNCKKAVANPKMDFGCAAYCKYAEVCLGELPPELIKEKANLLKTRLQVFVEKMLEPKTYQEILREVNNLEEELKAKERSPGVLILTFYFYFLTPEQREEIYKKMNLPDLLFEEIKINLNTLTQGLNPIQLKEKLLKESLIKRGGS